MAKNILRSDEECQRILAEMRAAGDQAARDWIARHSDNDAVGFAWVVIPKAEYSLRRTAGSPFPRRLSGRGDAPTAWANCGHYQSISAHEAVARAMVESLKSNGVDAHHESRMD